MVINKEDSTSWNSRPIDQLDMAIFLLCYVVSDQIRNKKSDHGVVGDAHNNLQQKIKTSFEKTNSGFRFLIK